MEKWNHCQIVETKLSNLLIIVLSFTAKLPYSQLVGGKTVWGKYSYSEYTGCGILGLFQVKVTEIKLKYVAYMENSTFRYDWIQVLG